MFCKAWQIPRYSYVFRSQMMVMMTIVTTMVRCRNVGILIIMAKAGNDNCNGNDSGQRLRCRDSNNSNGKSRGGEDGQGSILRGKTGAPFGI